MVTTKTTDGKTMAQHARNNDDTGRAAKHAAALASAHAARRHSEYAPAEQDEIFDQRIPQRPSNPQANQYQTAEDNRQQRRPRSLAEFARDNIVYILSVAAVVAIVALMLVFLRTCAPQETEEPTNNDADTVTNPYNWENLDTSSDRYAYVVDGQVKSRTGIDVSENQHEIDWNAVASDGIDFAMIRLGYRGATEGDLYIDEYYAENLAGAKAAGVPCGIYFFSQAQTVEEAVEEADFVLKQLNGVSLEYPIAYDSEEGVLGLEESRVSDLEKTDMTLIAKAFCARVEEAGYRSIIYGNASDLSRMHMDSLKGSNLWWAEYDTSEPSTDTAIAMWQYSNAGDVAGIETAVDMNIDLSDVRE